MSKPYLLPCFPSIILIYITIFGCPEVASLEMPTFGYQKLKPKATSPQYVNIVMLNSKFSFYFILNSFWFWKDFYFGWEGFWVQPQGPNLLSRWATVLALLLDCSTAALPTPQKVSSIWKLVELKMLDFSICMRTGISILTSAASNWKELLSLFLQSFVFSVVVANPNQDYFSNQ